jgi:hypothetical protein
MASQFLQLFLSLMMYAVEQPGWRRSRLIAVSRIQPKDSSILVSMSDKRRHLGRRSSQPIVHRFEFTAINRNPVTVQKRPTWT